MADDGLSRREFLGTMTVASGTMFLGGCASSSPGIAPVAASSARIGVQLYTVRDQLTRDFEGTIEQVAAIGYKEVEPYDLFGRTPQAVRALLDRLDITAPSAHIPLARFRDDLNGLLDSAETIGYQYLVIPSLDGSLRNTNGYRSIAADLNRWGRAARDRGLRVGDHNHDFEFASLPEGGRGIDIMLAETDPALVEFELDIYWAVKGGQDPVAFFARHPGRFPLWHVKDMTDRAGAQRMADVGTGELDFAAMFAQRQRAGLTHFFVERDDPTDSLASIRNSYANLVRLLS
jgi:sugar phosphate isomerase/epimerase